MATIAFVRRAASDAITSAIAANGKSLAEQITEKACTLLEEKIPVVTDKLITHLNNKIDSEGFSEKFVNVLQQKVLDEKVTSEPFLSKFSVLFDKIIKKAEENNNTEKQTTDDDSQNTYPIADANEYAIAEAIPIKNAGDNTDNNNALGQEAKSDNSLVEEANPNQLGGNAKRTTRRGKRKVKMQTRKRKRRTNKRRNKK